MKFNSPITLLLVTGLAFGCNFPLGKMAVEAGVNPAVWAVVICFGAGVTVLVAARLFEEAHPQPVPGMMRYAVTSSLVSNVIPLTLTFSAMPHIGAGLTAILVATSPISTALLSMLFKVRPPRLLDLAGLALGLVGAIIIVIARHQFLPGGSTGWLLAAASIPLFLGAGNVYRSLGWPRGAAPMRLGAAVNLAAVPPLLLLAGLQGELSLSGLTQVPVLVAVQLAAATLMYITFFRLQAVGGPTYLSQIGYVAAAVGVGIGVSLLGERYPPLVWLGIGVIALGIALTSLSQRRR
ncbi:DMT family transporter [Aestuariivirga sp.]|jgi:drug/metabolite transporter (DMT)-like permease|uniref:DMT family transporter n=1 Tax=Aestuariivirga sp. TaxID=2650926 RepID=UPI003783B51E